MSDNPAKPSEEDTPHPVDIHVGRMIRILRNRRGASQTTLAEAVNVSFQQVQKYERGANRISASKLFEMSRFFGVSVDVFYGGLDGDTLIGDMRAVEDVLDFVATPEGAEIARVFPRIPAAQRRKLVELAALLAP